jgi:hypothetical protein
MFEVLAEGLEPFVDTHMTPAAAKADGDWVRMLEARERATHGSAKSLHRRDPAVLLEVLTEYRAVFKDALSRVEQSFASELRDTRNRWAHNEAFTVDDTYRALDTAERLLIAVGATGPADEVHRLRLDHQRAAFEAETRRMARAADGTASVAGTGLKPWRDVLPPHDDVATGNFTASEFAADLHMVALGGGGDDRAGQVGPEYGDPVEFFRTCCPGWRSSVCRRTSRTSWPGGPSRRTSAGWPWWAPTCP